MITERRVMSSALGFPSKHSTAVPVPSVRRESLPIPIRATSTVARPQALQATPTTVRRACTTTSPGQQLDAVLSSEMSLPGFQQLEKDILRAAAIAQQKGRANNLKFIAGVLASYGYTIKMRSARDSRTSTDYLTKPKHTFLIVSSGIEEYEGPEVLVELEFSDNFEVAKPTQRYSKFMQHVPETLIATKETMKTILDLVYNEMEQCFESQAQFMPPWRMLTSLVSKWLPQRFSDVCVLEEITSDSDTEEAVSPVSVLPSPVKSKSTSSCDVQTILDVYASPQRSKVGRKLVVLGL